MKTKYVAKVQILIEADSEAEACDSISECLSGNLKYNGAILDWSYLPDSYEAPVEVSNEKAEELFDEITPI